MNAPVLVLAWGNRARGDDALGPLFADRLRALALPGVEVLEDHQLMPEHALDLEGRERVLFVDASAAAAAPFEAAAVAPDAAWGVTTHGMSPSALMSVHARLGIGPTPVCVQLAIRGERFGLGESLSAEAEHRLAAALDWAIAWLARKAEGPHGRRAFEGSGGASGT